MMGWKAVLGLAVVGVVVVGVKGSGCGDPRRGGVGDLVGTDAGEDADPEGGGLQVGLWGLTIFFGWKIKR